ncbi:hypothetical protein ACHAWO_013534 [Cyclotella atomus]|uniref:ADP,ATP carrier protein n=1 Tax=Cyclotella atomus TaxID=382360 RepID=A0ABD3PRR8_9STRA
MADRDPFPMRSEEAQRLAASVQDQNGPSWHKMGTTTALSSGKSTKTSSESTKARESLVKHKSSKSKNNESESIYDQDELDQVQGRLNNEEDGEEDDFIEAPLSHNHLTARDVADLPTPLATLILSLQSCYFSIRNVAKRLHRKVYGDSFPWEDFTKTLVLSSTLFIMIGGYWLLRSLKDPVLTALCGVGSIPKAKMLSVFVVLGVVAVYNHMLDEESGFRKEQLFYVFGSFYGTLFLIIAYLLNHPTIGLANQTEDPTRLLGWVSYCGIESFGSVMVSLFWSFANSNFNLKQAKRSYGMMVATAQLGSILGPTFVNSYGKSLGIPICYLVGATCMLSLQVTMWIYVKMFGVAEDVKSNEEEKIVEKREEKKPKGKAGILEGIHLFMKYNYVKGIFAISCLFMVEVTIVDYTMKVLARERFSEEFPCKPFNDAGEAMACWSTETNSPVGMSTEALASFTTFMGLFGQATNMLSFCLSFFGTSAVIRYLGLRSTLLLFPSICLIVIVTVRLYPTLDVVFAAMMILKANSYALNNPTKEMLYQPTNSNVKYKAKSWIDIFGARGSKALGSVVTNAFSHSAAELVDKGSIVGMCVASFLIWNANFMGKKFDEFTETGYIVGDSVNDDEVGEGEYSEINGEDKNLEMASRQNNESDSTSCAFYEDDEIGAEEEGQSETEGGDVEEKDEKHVTELV